MIRLTAAILLIFLFSKVDGQHQTDSEIERISLEKLEKFASRMVNDSIVENRIEANNLLKNSLFNVLKDPKSLNHDFEDFESVSVVESGDDHFRIFSWQLYISANEYRHEGIIQFYNGDQEPIILVDQSDKIRNAERKELTPDQWFGALYYNIVPFKSKGKKKYLLFGFDGASSKENCKIVDILSIDSKKLSFGAPLFITKKSGMQIESFRILHQYDQNVKAVLNYDPELEIIIFDHLIPWTSKEIGVGMTFVPDGSYQGFELKKGKWKLIPKVFTHISFSPVGPNNPNGAVISDSDQQD